MHFQCLYSALNRRATGGGDLYAGPISMRLGPGLDKGGGRRLLVTSHWPVSRAAAVADAVCIAASGNNGGGRRLLVTCH